ncbi:MAG: ATP-dependent DNA helicase RecG [Acidimicrobiia bacterium]|nr:MAG: ATP-dependent DNA helicase RecG [Acidimicrobiia bacterium]
MTAPPTGQTGRSLAYLATLPADLVKGIGPATAKKLGEVGINSIADLLLHVPRRYLDRSQMFDLSNVPIGEEVTVGGTVVTVNRRRISRKRTMVEADISDGTSVLHAVWFNPYIKIVVGQEVALSGKAELFRGRLQMKAPDLDRLDDDDSLVTGRVVPVHPRVGGLTPYKIRQSMDNALGRARPITEVLPEDMIERLGLIGRDQAVYSVHFPQERADADRARARLVFDELFRLQVALALRKRRQIDEARGVVLDVEGDLTTMFVDSLPFELTAGQRAVIDDIRSDLASQHPMHRLLQGEVGSGKTVVALTALLVGVEAGYQAAIMAPTEVLADQHYLSTVAAIEDAGLAPAGIDGAAGTANLFEKGDAPEVRVALLTANRAISNIGSEISRPDLLALIAGGDIDLVVGTHSLIQEGVEFARLGVAVVDEQHRFGVHQRVELREKARDYDPDLLIMTATPIPRTLAMTLYGDLDVSVLDEMPPGHLDVATRHVGPGDTSVDDLVRSEVIAGHQAFIVCPLVEDSDKLQAKSATAEYERLTGVYPDLALGLLHGQMRPAEKDDVMRRFRSGEIDVLVATTVIEVGIDVPNATVMVIEDADRFGLNQLHQLRGRVGRPHPDGALPAFCILVADPTTPEGEARIEAMVATNDGFRLAEEDLRIRGQGTVFGARQSGMTDLKLADLLRDLDVLVTARREALALVQQDPKLNEHPDLAEEVRLLLGDDDEWLQRS